MFGLFDKVFGTLPIVELENIYMTIHEQGYARKQIQFIFGIDPEDAIRKYILKEFEGHLLEYELCNGILSKISFIASQNAIIPSELFETEVIKVRSSRFINDYARITIEFREYEILEVQQLQRNKDA